MPCRCPRRYTKYLTFLKYARERAILCVFCLSVISRWERGKEWEGINKDKKRIKQSKMGKKVMQMVNHINPQGLYINFYFLKVLYFSILHTSNINQKIWI